MGKYYFNLDKFKEWRKLRENLDETTLNIIVEFQELEKFDGMEYNKMFKLGKLVIKDWCDYEEDDAIRI